MQVPRCSTCNRGTSSWMVKGENHVQRFAALHLERCIQWLSSSLVRRCINSGLYTKNRGPDVQQYRRNHCHRRRIKNFGDNHFPLLSHNLLVPVGKWHDRFKTQLSETTDDILTKSSRWHSETNTAKQLEALKGTVEFMMEYQYTRRYHWTSYDWSKHATWNRLFQVCNSHFRMPRRIKRIFMSRTRSTSYSFERVLKALFIWPQENICPDEQPSSADFERT